MPNTRGVDERGLGEDAPEQNDSTHERHPRLFYDEVTTLRVRKGFDFAKPEPSLRSSKKQSSCNKITDDERGLAKARKSVSQLEGRLRVVKLAIVTYKRSIEISEEVIRRTRREAAPLVEEIEWRHQSIERLGKLREVKKPGHKLPMWLVYLKLVTGSHPSRNEIRLAHWEETVRNHAIIPNEIRRYEEEISRIEVNLKPKAMLVKRHVAIIEKYKRRISGREDQIKNMQREIAMANIERVKKAGSRCY